jgi:signal transduction histidine kinase/ligand-binding sensor domain-containing protein
MPLRALTCRAVAGFLSAAALIASLGAYDRASAQQPPFAEMDHKSWTARDGAPQSVNALAQALDGVMWVGSDAGLFSFDGRTFTAFEARPGEPDLPFGPVDSLFAARDGAIWAGLRYGGIARIAGGHATLFTNAGSLPLVRVDDIRQAPDGALWALVNQQAIIRFGLDGRFHAEPTPLGLQGGRIRDIFIDSTNSLWVGQGGRLYRRPLNQPKYSPTEAAVDWIFGFAEAPDHSLWINDAITGNPSGPTGRTQHIDPSGKVLTRLPESDGAATDLVYEPDGSLIMASQGVGLLRFPTEALTRPPPAAARVPRDRYGAKDGLSSNRPNSLLLDNDGNLWVGGQRGLDRFREARLIAFVSKDGTHEPQVCAGTDGAMWVAPGGDHEELYKISGGAQQLAPHSGQIASMSCGPYGDVWLAATTGIWRISAGRIMSLPPIAKLAPFAVHQVVATPDRILFASVLAAPDVTGIWRYAHGSWSKLVGPDMSPSAMYVDSQSRLWAGYRDGLITLPLEGGRRIPIAGSLKLGPVYAFLETSQGLFASSLNGLAILRNNRFEMLNFADRFSARGVAGLVESGNGDLWLNTLRGVVHVRSEDLRSALLNPKTPIKSELLTEGDFVGPVDLWPGKPLAARGADGKLWFATLNGVFHIDPGHLHTGIHPPIVSIRLMSADNRPVGDGAKMDPGPQTLDIQYLGVNLTTPESVTYRYRLDGLDNTWQEAGHRTEATYAHLRPGAYTFRVIASNGDDIWTPASSATFKVLPYFYQTTWFLLLCGLAGLLLVWLTFTLRVRVLAREIRARAEERADERIRIARELHDTLLQGIQGLLLTVHVAAQKVSKGEDSTTLLDNALSTADKIIIEGRNRVNSLRSEHLTDAELGDALENVGIDLNRDDKIEFRVERQGIDAALHPHVADEAFYIAREALTNAFRHAEASEIAVELTYGRRYFSLSCTDNGCGFDVSDDEKPGHWGLRGMVERAQKLGGRLRVRSGPLRGTQILFAIPSYRAYERYSRLTFFLRAHHRSERNPTKE